MANYKQMAERARKSAAAAKADGARMMGMMGGAGLIGLMVKSGAVDRLPDIGVPKTLVLAGVGKAIGYNMNGTFGEAADGLGNAAAVVAIFQWTTGQTVSGMAGASMAGREGNSLDRERAIAKQLARATQRKLAAGGGDDDDIGDLEALAEVLPDAAE